jgi:DNA-binding transcriptional regulator GbsR (MarR family)
VRSDIDGEIVRLLEKEELTVAFITRFLLEGGLEVTRQGVERSLRRMVSLGVVEAFYTNGNRRKHYRLVR